MKRFLLAFSFLCVAGLASRAQERCYSHEYAQQLIHADPALEKRMHAFDTKKAWGHSQAINRDLGSGELIIRIPVVVHVLYNDASQNISEEQIRSQIDALNRDFRRMNADTVNTPEGYKERAADCRIEFALANVDPRGFATNGIVRRKTNIQYFSLDDRIKSTAIGGDDPWPTESYLNIWVGSLAGTLFGYSSPVYGPRDKDGVVVSYAAFGTVGALASSFKKGRVAVHEVGHWLGLRHIWGDRYCGDDYVDDTPPQQTKSYGCPTGTPISCGNAPYGNMFMNYMDVSGDACTNMFTRGQKEKMRSLFTPGEYREALLISKGADGNGVPAPVESPMEPEPASLSLYPNPVHGTLTIDLRTNTQLVGETVTLFNQIGQQVMQARVTKTIFNINIHHLQDGMYFVRIGGKSYRVSKLAH